MWVWAGSIPWRAGREVSSREPRLGEGAYDSYLHIFAYRTALKEGIAESPSLCVASPARVPKKPGAGMHGHMYGHVCMRAHVNA